MSVVRMLPRSYESIWTGIHRAKLKKDNPPAYGNILSDATSLRIDTLAVDFPVARIDLATKLAQSGAATVNKDKVVDMQKMLNSQYIQNLNFHIDLGLFPATYRSCYKIPSISNVVPDQNSEDAIDTLAQNIIAGEALMILAGGTAILFPNILSIQTNLTLFNAKQIAQSNAIDASDKAKEDLKVLSSEGATVVKKAWDEVETYYDEGTIESKRKNSREWGVLYISVGNPISIVGHIMEMVLGAPTPVIGVKAYIADTEEVAYSTAEGAIILKTNATGTIVITFSMEGFADLPVTVEINNSNTIDLGIVVMVRMGR